MSIIETQFLAESEVSEAWPDAVAVVVATGDANTRFLELMSAALTEVAEHPRWAELNVILSQPAEHAGERWYTAALVEPSARAWPDAVAEGRSLVGTGGVRWPATSLFAVMRGVAAVRETGTEPWRGDTDMAGPEITIVPLEDLADMWPRALVLVVAVGGPDASRVGVMNAALEGALECDLWDRAYSVLVRQGQRRSEVRVTVLLLSKPTDRGP